MNPADSQRSISEREEPSAAPARGSEGFVTTHWSVVVAAGDSSSASVHAALEKLCRSYWYPLYVFVRRQGKTDEEAKDLTQAFFARLLERNYVRQADRERGRFRSFLIGALKHFLSDEWDKARAGKRGGGIPALSLDDAAADERYALEPADDATPDKLFDRRWALTTLEEATRRLRQEYHEDGRGELFDLVQTALAGADGVTYADLACRMGMSENTLKSHVHRLKARNREILRAVIAETVVTPGQVDQELRDLFAALSGA
jgi:RNA polymerase sigma-70 factor (ECF subfamily)